MKKELEQLQGTWTVISMEDGGTRPEERELAKKFKVAVQGKKLTFTYEKKVLVWSIEIDPMATPKTIDVMVTDGGETETALGIYALNGDDLKICIDQKRPKEFKIIPGSGKRLLTVLRRAKP